MSVIVSRALPDVRDGLKPVHRRILYAMNNLGLSSSAMFRKSATVVGEVIGNFHPHGDSSIYDAMVKMAQDFYMRYPLVQGQGNFGSIDGDSAAAMRYTEAKMSKLPGDLLRDIDKDTVDFVPNYDGTKKEPVVLPAAVPNLLLNGTLGIAVGMATKIPPHNLGELLDALMYLSEHKEATTEDLMQFVKGPDFPTGGLIFNEQDIMRASATGRGGVVMRGEAEIVEAKGGSQIIITSIPYQVNKAEMIKAIADRVREKQLEGIRDIRDESTKDIRVVIELKQGVFPQKVLNYLYKHSALEQTFNYNIVALVDGVPRTLSIKSVLEEFLKYRIEVVTRRTKFDLNKAEAREHILLGLKKALDHIDAIVKTIKASKDTSTAHANLIKTFKFSQLQATAILEMKLQRLAGLERKKIEDELKEVQKTITYLKGLLKDAKKMLGVVKDEFTKMREEYADERRTRVIAHGAKEIKPEDMVSEEENVLVLTSGGYIKRTSPIEYRAQHRGGVGVVDLDVKEEDFIVSFLTANTHDDMLFFSDRGKAYKIKMYELPEGKRATRGKSIMNFLQLEDSEHISSILAMPKVSANNKSNFLLMVTKQGVVKKVTAEQFKEVRRNGIIAITLQKDDELLSARLVEKGQTIVIITRDGQSIHFKETDARAMGRTATGVRAIKLRKGDEVVGVDVVIDPNKAEIMVMSSKGYGKRTKIGEYKVQGRGGSGIKTANVTEKTGALVIGCLVTDDHAELIAISKQGQVIRTGMGEIPTLSRATQGVRIMKLRAGDSIASLTLL